MASEFTECPSCQYGGGYTPFTGPFQCVNPRCELYKEVTLEEESEVTFDDILDPILWGYPPEAIKRLANPAVPPLIKEMGPRWYPPEDEGGYRLQEWCDWGGSEDGFWVAYDMLHPKQDISREKFRLPTNLVTPLLRLENTTLQQPVATLRRIDCIEMGEVFWYENKTCIIYYKYGSACNILSVFSGETNKNLPGKTMVRMIGDIKDLGKYESGTSGNLGPTGSTIEQDKAE